MIEFSQLTAEEIADLDVVTPSSTAETINKIHSRWMTRLIVTDPSGLVIYDSIGTGENKYALFPQIIKALEGNNVFTWKYASGVMRSEAATPIVAYGVTVGCVYMMELDAEQGAVIYSLNMTVLTITVFLELVIILYSAVFFRSYSRRMRKIMNSMRVIQDGNYSQKVTMSGNDELAFLAREFNDLTSRLQTSENKRRQFVSDASHELKTPLASIKLLSDSILQNDMDMDTVCEFVGDISEEAERLIRMTEKLLDLTRGEHTNEEESREIIYMAPSVEKVVHMLSPLADSSGVTIHTALSEDATILIREDDLYRIVYNLVENGIKYNVPGGSVTITLSQNEDSGIVSIADTGISIPEEALGKVFERFFRVDKARSRATGGSGLGLSIVRSMVERNEGRITVTSKQGVGSTFTVEFPAFYLEEDRP